MQARARLALVALALPLSGCGYGAIPAERDRAEAAWSDVQHQYQRRADLVPLLIANVQAGAGQTPVDLSELNRARAEVATAAATPDLLGQAEAFQAYEQAQADMDRALAAVLGAARVHPQLQANENVRTLEAQIEGPTHRVAVSRRDYNEAAQTYNAALRDFPTVVWASTLHAGAQPLPLSRTSTAASAAGEDEVEIGSQ